MSADLFAAFLDEDPKSKQPRDSAVQHPNAPSQEPLSFPSSDPIRRTLPGIERPSISSPLWQQDSSGTDVLFDAGDADHDDDFGDFETVDDPKSAGEKLQTFEQVSKSAAISTVQTSARSAPDLIPDLLDADDTISPPAQVNSAFSNAGGASITPKAVLGKADNAESQVEDDWGDFEEIPSHEAVKPISLDIGVDKPTHDETQATIADVQEDDWEPFDETPSPAVIKPSAIPNSNATLSGKSIPLAGSAQASTPAASARPTNIPPPSSLLQLLSKVFQSIHERKSAEQTQKQDLPSTVLMVFRTASRIVAGRTLRWKRDTILSQSVRIGAAGKSGGMKLASVNKSETTREERDTEEMIRDWSHYVHDFNGIIAQAGLPPQRMKLSSTTPLKVSKPTTGSQSSKQCALCGLVRTERLVDVDVGIDDLFGEFWTEHWGHKDCHDFWHSFKDMLEHR